MKIESIISRMYHGIGFIFIFLITACVSTQKIKLIDNSTSPNGATRQLELGNHRGNIAHVYYAPELSPGTASERIRQYKSTAAKSWVVKNWGMPDQVYSDGGVYYLVYIRNDVNAPHYERQTLSGDHPIKLGYKFNQLIYVESSSLNHKSFHGQNSYILPK